MKTISCTEAVDFILKNEEAKLSLMNRLRLWRHLTLCSLCRIFSKQNKLMNKAMKHRHETRFTLTREEKEKIIHNVMDDR